MQKNRIYSITSFAFFFLFISMGRSQVKVAVVDSLSRQPLSYATVYQFSSKSLFLCSNRGETKLNIPGADSIRVSYAGYFDKLLRVEKFKEVEVKLVKNIAVLPEVIVKPCAQWSKNISYKPAADSGKFGGFLWGNMGYKGRIAMYLPSPAARSKLAGITLYFKPGIRGTKEAAKAPILFSFYSIDTATMFPGELLTEKTILFRPQKMGRQQINLDSISLLIPDHGMYVALEGYQDDAYSYLVPTKMPDGEMDTVKMYGAALDGLYTKDTWLSFFNFETGAWLFGGNKPFEKTRRHGAISYEMKYVVCNDAQRTNAQPALRKRSKQKRL